MTLLNRVERAIVNNPIRSRLQRGLETKWLLEMGGAMQGGSALEIGCGRGIGTELILDRFNADHVDAFDLDQKMVRQAKKRLARRGDTVRIWNGDATHIATGDASYDAVFDFAIVHHVPNWRDALQEVHRVLKSGGRFYVEEVLKRFILNPIWRRILDHPLQDRFDHDGFCEALVAQNFKLLGSKQLWGWFGWFVAVKE